MGKPIKKLNTEILDHYSIGLYTKKAFYPKRFPPFLKVDLRSMAVKYFSRDERQVVFKEADVEHQRLACAARQGEALNIRQLVHAHPTLDLNEVDTTGNTCLGIAVQLGHEEVIEVLLKVRIPRITVSSKTKKEIRKSALCR